MRILCSMETAIDKRCEMDTDTAGNMDMDASHGNSQTMGTQTRWGTPQCVFIIL